MAAGGPEQGHRNVDQQHRQPDAQVIAHPPAEHQPAQGQKRQAVGDQMPEAGMAEWRCDHPPPRLIRPHRQVPLPRKQQLVDQLLPPGQGQDQQGKQQSSAHRLAPMTTMMTRMLSG